MTTRTITVPCLNCSGKGSFACFRHIWDGVCFRCEGEGTEEITLNEHERRIMPAGPLAILAVKVDGRVLEVASHNGCQVDVWDAEETDREGAMVGALFFHNDGVSASDGMKYAGRDMSQAGKRALFAAAREVARAAEAA